MLQRFLSVTDSTRALAVLRRLLQHGIEQWALTGGLAIGIHGVIAGGEPQSRSLNDLDFVTPHFADIPETIARNFLLRHVHPDEIPGRTMMQLVDVDAKARIDVFRANGATLTRACKVDLPLGELKVVALEDLIARTARLLFDLADGFPVPAKHAADFLRLADMMEPKDVQPAWRDHRKSGHPEVFSDARSLLLELIPNRSDLLIVSDYSKDVAVVCSRCASTSAFPLADPRAILSVLGYC